MLVRSLPEIASLFQYSWVSVLVSRILLAPTVNAIKCNHFCSASATTIEYHLFIVALRRIIDVWNRI
eukprot:scaffold22607_cov123-Cylindrotheca_fusiformis.AAC.7